MKEIRSQADELGDKYSKMGGIDCSKDPGLTRQEQAADADINNIMKRFGVSESQRPVMYGEQDFTYDLQQSIEAVREVKNAHAAMHTDLKKVFPTWQRFINAVETGEAEKTIQELERKRLEEEKKSEPAPK